MYKKLISLFICVIIFISSSVLISSKESTNRSNYSHTVFAGAALTQGCSPCHYWNQEIFSVYNSSEYDFQYASMIVYDKQGDVLIREAYDWDSYYGITTYPSTIFDGNYQRINGNHSDLLLGKINASGNRTVANISANITLNWLGNATINVNVTIKNNDSISYNGSIRAFVTEIVSRYNTVFGDPFHFGFLGFALIGNISIDPGETYTNSTNWNGNDHEDEHGNDFGDINSHNIKVILAVYNENDGYVDESNSAIIPNHPPSIPSNPYPANGSTGVDVNVDLSWFCEDSDDDPLTYNVYFGNNSPPPKVVDNQSDTTFNPGFLNIYTKYYWQIVVWDNYNESTTGPIWDFTTRINNPPNVPDKPTGPSNGSRGVEYTFFTRTTDPDDDQVFYKWDWGDGNISEWIGPFIHDTQASACYKWHKSGDFKLRVKAKDIVNSESNWSEAKDIHVVKPDLEIGNISGGLSKIKVSINNNGDGEAINLSWNINLYGGFFIRGQESSGNILKIKPGEQFNITSNRIFGIGRTEVAVTVETSDGDSLKKTENGLVFLFIIKV